MLFHKVKVPPRATRTHQAGMNPDILVSIAMAHKRKERKSMYIASAFIQRLVSKQSDVDHTVSTANYIMPTFPS